jgi:hypothetical protein
MPRNRNGDPISADIPTMPPIATTRDPGPAISGTGTQTALAQRAPSDFERARLQIMEDLLPPPLHLDPLSVLRDRAPPRWYSEPVPNTVAPPGNPPISPRQHREGMSIRPEPMPYVRPIERSLHPSTFTQLTLTDQQLGDIAEINLAADQFAREIDRLVPSDIGKQGIMDKLREIVFWARETILRYPNGEPRATPRYDPLLDCAAGAAGATVIPGPAGQPVRINRPPTAAEWLNMNPRAE